MVKLTNWTWYATGPGAGIQIEHGPYRGRLVIPCDHIEAGTRRYYSHVVISDDHGDSWKLGGSTPQDQVNECEVVELTGGRLLLNMRKYNPAQRLRQQAVSEDGGRTWTGQRHVPELVDPICQASIRRLTWAGIDHQSVILFSNPKTSDEIQTRLQNTYLENYLTTHTFAQMLKRQESNYRQLLQIFDEEVIKDDEIIDEVELEIKYEGYIKRQLQQIGQFRKLEQRSIPPTFDYKSVPGFSREVLEKFVRVRPSTIGQASRISGVTPASISLLIVALENFKRNGPRPEQVSSINSETVATPRSST